MKKLLLPILISIVFLAGCGRNYSITYNTEPTGASIICEGINEGYSPVTLYYTPDKKATKSGSMKTKPCYAIWSSGARENFGTTWNLNKFPNGVIETATRERNSGYSQDAEFALKVKQMNKVEAASSGGYYYSKPKYPKQTTTNCRKYGNMVSCTSY